MSDDYLKIIPEDLSFVPDESGYEKAIQKLESWTPDGEEVEIQVYDHVEFIDQGENLEAIICPACNKRLNKLDDNLVNDWWENANLGADMTKGEGVFRLDDSCVVKMPCCRKEVKFTDLKFDWPAGFARFELSAHNPYLESNLSDDRLHELEEILVCKLIQIRASY